jgi:hypothetical protein
MQKYEGNLQQDLATVTRNGLADRITGGLSQPGKMPEFAWGLPAVRCKAGAILAKQSDTVCSHCYAMKGRYNFAKVQHRLDRRFNGLEHPLWVPAMAFLIRWKVARYFRWFDSGDLQSSEHLHNICLVASHTREILHWLPTREYDLVHGYDDAVPDNLTIRVSSNMLDDVPPSWWPQTSTVITHQEEVTGHLCPAPEQDNSCGNCRACWQRDVSNVSYRLH